MQRDPDSGETGMMEIKQARSMASGLCRKRIVDYGSLWGVAVNVLNEQLTCGVSPTLPTL